MTTNLELRDKVIHNRNLFDEPFYLQQNPDVRRFAGNPLTHYLRYGWKEGRLPYREVDDKPTPPSVVRQLAPSLKPVSTYDFALKHPKHLGPLPENPRMYAVIPTIWKKPDLTLPLLQWLTEHQVTCILVDNRESGDNLPWNGLIVHDKRPFNFSRLCNLGFNHCEDADMVLFMNDDQRVIQENWLDEIITAMRNDDTIGCAGPVTVNPDGSIQGAGAICRLEGSGVIGNHELTEANHPFECHSIGGCCMVFRAKAFPKFDEGYQITHSDNVVCMDTRDQGYRVMTVPTSRIEHHEKSSRAPLGDPPEDIVRFWKTRWPDIFMAAQKSPSVSVYQREQVPPDIQSIILVKLDHIGDIFMAKDAIDRLQEKFPHAKMRVVCATWAQPIFQKWGIQIAATCDYWTAGGVVSSMQGMSSAESKKISQLHCDLAVDLRIAPEARSVIQTIQAKHRVFAEAWMPRQLSHKQQLDVLIASVTVAKPFISPETGIIGINRHASAHGKIWPHWDALISWFELHHIPFKSYGDKDAAIEDYAELVVSECDVYIGHDTGPTHAVAAMGLPVVELIGGIVPVMEWLAMGNVIGLGVKTSCSPCYKPQGCQSMQCLGVQVEDVLWAISRALSASG